MLGTRHEFGNAFQQMREFERQMNRLLYGQPRRAPTNGSSKETLGDYPAVNAWEDEVNFMLEAELPGVTSDDLEIHVSAGNQLTIKGARREVISDGAWHRRERGHGEFVRMLTLPVAVDAENVEAELKDGVLKITLHKEAAFQPRKIEVKAS